MPEKTFIVDCSNCRAKVAAETSGMAENSGRYYDSEEPYGERLYVGKCPVCGSLLAGKSHQTAFAQWDDEFDRWSDVIRIYPDPPKVFSSRRIPCLVTDSLIEADRALQAGAHTAACVMFGRALEAVCRNMLESSSTEKTNCNQPHTAQEIATNKKKVMLAKGILELKNRNFIDQRLYDWSQQLQAFRNIAAHPDDVSISVQDAEDLQTFVYAIVEYIYDLADRYEQFKKRIERREKKELERKGK